MNRYDFDWDTQPVQYPKINLTTAPHLAIRGLAVVYKNFLVPMANHDLNSWKKNDHYRHHLSELEEVDGDKVWIKPWIVGGWFHERATVFEFEAAEFNEEAFDTPLLEALNHWRKHHRRGALLGFHLTVNRPEQFFGVFSFKVDDPADGGSLGDLLVREVLSVSVEGDRKKLEQWLDWSYRKGRIV